MNHNPSSVRRVLLSLCLCAGALTGCSSAPPPRPAGFVPIFQTPAHARETGTIEVAISGIPAVEGQLFVELYDQDTYFHYDRVLAEKIVPVTGRQMVVPLEHVPPGRYIIAVSHDANANHAMDTGLFGVPKEAYGFSRGARGTFGPPEFEAGAFDFKGGTTLAPVAVR